MQPKLLLLLLSLFFKLLGAQPPQTAIILLQNNQELRATGGFMGSYAKVGFSSKKGQTKDFPSDGSAAWVTAFDAGFSEVESVSLSFQDIYVPDGQIQGHVEPPAPIQQAFGQGWFRLRDANWDPDFPTSAKAIRWFLEKGGEINPDILIAINLSTIQKILTITGPLHVKGPTLDMDADNISLLLQNNIQQNFFPGSTNKKDVITATGQALSQKIANLSFKQKIKIIKIIFQDLKNGEILINSKDPQLQTWLEKKNYAGQLQPTPCTSKVHSCLSDTLAIIESNLGSNKANAYITRHTTHQVTMGSELSAVCSVAKDSPEPCTQYITHTITLNYKNSSPSPNPNPPLHHGGDYINYLRFYIPTQATNIQVKDHSTTEVSQDFSSDGGRSKAKDSSEVKSVKTTLKHNFKEIGFFHLTRHQSTSSVTLSYQLPITNKKFYQLTLLKQPGITNSPQTINLFGQIQNPNLTHDLQLKVKNL